MTHTSEPDQPPVLSLKDIAKAFADFYVSRLTTDEIREISFAFDHHVQNRLFVVDKPTTPDLLIEQEEEQQ